MMTIKIKLAGSEEIKTVNATLEETAKSCFARTEVQEIEIVDGGVLQDNEYLTMTATRLYRASQEEIEEFMLWNNIRYCFRVEYKPEYKNKKAPGGGIYKDYETSAGLCNV